MQVQRCPECGGRLTTNYCDICMRKVPFRGARKPRNRDPWDASSAHRAEKGHECVSFDMPAQQPKRKPLKTITFPQKRSAQKTGTKVKGIAIVLAVMSVLSGIFGFVEELATETFTPEYDMEAFVEVSDLPQIAPTELYNDGQIVVTAESVGLYYDDYTVAVRVQNDSDRDVSVDSKLLSVNGYMVDSRLNAHVSAGENYLVLLQLYNYELEEMGITEVAEIAFCLELYDSKTYDTIATTDLITLKTDIAEGFVQPVDDTGWEMHADDYLRMVYRGTEVSTYGDADLALYIENLSDWTVDVTIDIVYINGVSVEGFLWDTLRADTRTVDSLYIYGLEELEITQLSQITEISLEYTVNVYDGDRTVDTVYCSVLFNPNALPTSD